MSQCMLLRKVLCLTIAGVFGSFPLIDCDYSEKDLTFVVDCQSNVEEQINFIKKLEDHVRNERKWKISRSHTYMTNGQGQMIKFDLNSTESVKQCEMKRSAEEIIKETIAMFHVRPKRTHLHFVFVSSKANVNISFTAEFNFSSKFEFDETLIDTIDKLTVESKQKVFFITELHIPSRYIYWKSSFKDLNVQELYRLVCDVKCTQTSLTFTSYGFQQSFYHIDKVSNITFMDGVQYCRSQYNSYMLSIETYEELEFIMSTFKHLRQSMIDKYDRLIVGLQARNYYSNNFWDLVYSLFRINFWESGNPFIYYTKLKYDKTCFYINAKTHFNADKIFTRFFIEYNCDEVLSNVYISCECSNYLGYSGYSRINITNEFDPDAWILFSPLDVTRLDSGSFFKRQIIVDLINCTNISGATIDPLEVLACYHLCTVFLEQEYGDGYSMRPGTKIEKLGNIKLVELQTPLYNASHSLLPHKSIIQHFSLIDILEIHTQHCEIKNVEKAFIDWEISKLMILDVSFNEITDLNNLTKLAQLLYLNVSHNELLTIGDEYMFPHLLQVIDLSYTNIQSLPLNLFKSLINLKHLNLRNTKIKSFHDLLIPPKFELFTFDIRGLTMEDVTVDYFHNLSIKSLILTDDYRLCCPVVLGKLIPPDKCIAPRDVISTCQHLVGDTFKRVTIWIIGIVTLAGNGAVLIDRLLWSKQMTAKSYDTFVTGLAVSDLLMGIYLIIIASVDIHYHDEYVFKDSEWKRSYFCLFSGFLSTLSSEMSTFFICLITLDRFLAIRFPFRQPTFSTPSRRLSISVVCLTASALALIPAIYPTWQIYSSNGLCLALPLSYKKFVGWQYNVAVCMIVNFVLFLIIASGQVAIFASIVSGKRSIESSVTKNSKNRAQEISVAKKLAFVAVSDFLCWFPIGIMGMFSLNGHEFGPDVYTWTAVFVLPVNSAVNPLIYTLPVIYNRIRQLDYGVSSLSSGGVANKSGPRGEP
ncbi:hypothetical protein Btru_059177 [Bulinus truncatus]|nr:hypothetical protein Btru_059177 [Bulinus truncatus]